MEIETISKLRTDFDLDQWVADITAVVVGMLVYAHRGESWPDDMVSEAVKHLKKITYSKEYLEGLLEDEWKN